MHFIITIGYLLIWQYMCYSNIRSHQIRSYFVNLTKASPINLCNLECILRLNAQEFSDIGERALEYIYYTTLLIKRHVAPGHNISDYFKNAKLT